MESRQVVASTGSEKWQAFETDCLERFTVIAGYKTKVRLGDQFCQGLREIADAQQVPVSTAVANIEVDPAR
jgi:predicted DNA-binding ribbon-helix-helix protein